VFDNFDKKTILEEVKYSVGLSLKDTYQVANVSFKVDGEEITTFN